MPVEGVDVSNHQGDISWSDVATAVPGIAFAFIKASQGTYFNDPYFAANVKGAKENGILAAPYHYLDNSNPVAQAEHFYTQVQRIGGRSGLMQIAVDFEETFGQNRVTALQTFEAFSARCKTLFGVDPILYTYPYFWVRLMGNPGGYSQYPLWYAHYASAPGPLPMSWKYWSFWQYTSTGHVKGISTIVDRNLFNGSLDNLHKFVMK